MDKRKLKHLGYRIMKKSYVLLLLLFSLVVLFSSNVSAYTLITDKDEFYSMYENPTLDWEVNAEGLGLGATGFELKSHRWVPFLYTGPGWGVFSTIITLDSEGYHPINPAFGNVLVLSMPRDWDDPFAFYVGGGFYGIIPDVTEDGYAIGPLLTGLEAGFSEVTQEPAPIPEPSTILLMVSGLIGLAGLRRKFKKQ